MPVQLSRSLRTAEDSTRYLSLFVVPTLQWSRNRTTTERRSSRSTCEISGVLQWSRNRTTTERINYAELGRWVYELQWSRNRTTTESSLEHPQASSAGSFNGAVIERLRKGGFDQEVKYERVLLQWSCNRTTTERTTWKNCCPKCTPSFNGAVIEPLRKVQQWVRERRRQQASMEP